MTVPEVAWLAGLVEGEGTFSRPQSRWGLLRVVMTDRDVVSRAHALVGVGSLVGLKARQLQHKQPWAWSVTRRGNVRDLCRELGPFLLSRRTARVEEILAEHGMKPPMPMSLTPGSDLAWAWAAGLIEGEGWIGPSPESERRKPVVGVQSTDQDVIERLAEIVGCGHMVHIASRRSGHKAMWRWSATSRADARDVLQAIMPHMGERRTERGKYVLELVG